MRVASLALTLLFAGCAKPATEYLLHIESNISADQLQAVKVITWASSDEAMSNVTQSSCFCVGDCRPLPVTLALLPTNDDHRRFELEVGGFDASSPDCTSPMIVSHATLQFVPRQTLDVYIDLSADCLGVVCDPSQTCVAHQCVDPGMGGTITTADGGQTIPPDLATTDFAQSSLADLSHPDLYGVDQARPFCFVTGTAVRIGDGRRRPIEAIAVGDAVAAAEELTQWSPVLPRPASVGATMAHEVHEVLALDVEGTEVLVTSEHPFAVMGHGFVRAGQLQVGDPLVRSNGTAALIRRIELRYGSFTVHTLTVEGDHTYFVSDLELLVHNKPPLP